MLTQQATETKRKQLRVSLWVTLLGIQFKQGDISSYKEHSGKTFRLNDCLGLSVEPWGWVAESNPVKTFEYEVWLQSESWGSAFSYPPGLGMVDPGGASDSLLLFVGVLIRNWKGQL